MVVVGGNRERGVVASQSTGIAVVGLATTDIELVFLASGMGPVGPQGPQGHAVTVYAQAVAPTVGLYPGDVWIKKPPVATPQPSYLWDGTAWVQLHSDASTLDALAGVTVGNPVTGDVLRHNGTEFVNVPGTTYYQAADADLSSIAALLSAPDRMLYATGPQTWALTPITDVGRNLVGANTATAVRTYLDVWSKTEIGNPETDFVAVFNAGLLGS